MTILQYGHTKTYFINGLLIDTDYSGTINQFFKCIKESNININDIKYILATHYHPDHIGIVPELMKLGIKLIVIDIQKDYIHFSDNIYKKDKLPFEPIDESKIILLPINKGREFFKSLNIDGEIISTTSHSNDSITIIFDNGDCIIGDIEPESYIDIYKSNNKLKEDWDKINSYNTKKIYYSHH